MCEYNDVTFYDPLIRGDPLSTRDVAKWLQDYNNDCSDDV